MHGQSIYEIKKICHRAHFFIISYGSFQHLANFLDKTQVFYVKGDSKVSKGAKFRNRYNRVPHLTQDTNGKVTNSQLDTTNQPFPSR